MAGLLAARVANAYVERLLRVAEHDPIVAGAFNDVCDLLAPPQEAMRPTILWRVLRGNLAPAPDPRESWIGARALRR